MILRIGRIAGRNQRRSCLIEPPKLRERQPLAVTGLGCIGAGDFGEPLVRGGKSSGGIGSNHGEAALQPRGHTLRRLRFAGRFAR